MRSRAGKLVVAALVAAVCCVAPAAAQTARGPAPKKLVVIDAGHGGVDPGARGPGGSLEKHLALAVARQVAARLREDPSFEVRMTRDRDTLIALRDRPRLANRWRDEGQPALFLSIHLNANTHATAHGFETYFLSDAKTEDARRVAEMENAAERYEREADEKPDADPLRFILADLRQNKYLHESSAWAAGIQRALDVQLTAPNRGVKQAGFVVLNGAFMPAVLVEIGFITNPAEERLLNDPEYQRRIARALAASVVTYFETESAAEPRAGR